MTSRSLGANVPRWTDARPTNPVFSSRHAEDSRSGCLGIHAPLPETHPFDYEELVAETLEARFNINAHINHPPTVHTLSLAPPAYRSLT